MHSTSSKTFQKIADFHRGGTRVPVSAAEPNVSDDSDNEASLWAKPVVVLSPI